MDEASSHTYEILDPSHITDMEKMFGIAKKYHSIGSLLRNWIMYMIRYLILKEEKVAFHSGSVPVTNIFFQKLNTKILIMTIFKVFKIFG